MRLFAYIFFVLILIKPLQSRAEDIVSSVNSAIINNYNIVKSHARVKQSESNLAKAQSSIGPTLGISSALSYYDNRVTTPSTYYKDNSKKLTLVTRLSQPIDFLSGHRGHYAINAKQEELQAAHESSDYSKQTLIFDTIKAYSDLAYAKKVIGLRQKSLMNLEEELRSIKEKIFRGEASSIDLSRTQMRYYEARVHKKEAEVDYISKIAQYQRIVGRAPIGDLSDIIQADIKMANFGALQSRMMRHNKLIKNLEFLEKAAGYDVEVSKAAYAPKVSTVATYTYNKSPDTIISTQKLHGVTLELNLSIDLIDSGSRSASIDKMESAHIEKQSNLYIQKQALLAELRSIWELYDTGKAMLKIRKDYVDAARATWYGINQKKMLNEVTELEVLDAEKDVVNAEVSLALVQKNLVVYSYQLLLLMGELDVKTLS